MIQGRNAAKGGGAAPKVLDEELTLSQPGGQIMPTPVLQALSDFQTLQQPLVPFSIFRSRIRDGTICSFFCFLSKLMVLMNLTFFATLKKISEVTLNL